MANSNKGKPMLRDLVYVWDSHIYSPLFATIQASTSLPYPRLTSGKVTASHATTTNGKNAWEFANLLMDEKTVTVSIDSGRHWLVVQDEQA